MDSLQQDSNLPVQNALDSTVVSAPQKRQRKKKISDDNPSKINKSSSNFISPRASSVIGVTRSISACLRCRMRKTRCDQKFPSCTSCLKANVECVGIDAATGREIPRSYVSHLEDRVAYLELQLQKHGIIYDQKTSSLPPEPTCAETQQNLPPLSFTAPTVPELSSEDRYSKVNTIMSGVKLVSVRAASTPPLSYLGSSSGLSFARILFTAAKFQSPSNFSKDSTNKNSTPPVDSSVKTDKINPASLPPKHAAEQLISIFFELANSQLPILHREQFLVKYFRPIYGKISKNVSLASEYTTVGVPVCDSSDEVDKNSYYAKHYLNTKLPQPNSSPDASESFSSKTKSSNMPSIDLDSTYRSTPMSINPAESLPSLFFLNIIFGIATSAHHQNYPAHLSESFRLAAMTHVDSVFSSQNRLEALQGILLLALYSVMRPAVPGIWYVLGSAMRLCIDLGLHNESETLTLRGNAKDSSKNPNLFQTSNAHLHNQFDYDPATLDLRRRLFWCTYALDRQVCVYLGRPVGIPDYCINVPFPSELDDALIVDSSFGVPSNTIKDYSLVKSTSSSYKTISLMFFKIRKLQSEIQKVLYDCAPLSREFSSLDEWRHIMAIKIENWHKECPRSRKRMNCNFNLGFIELNYHQTRLLLFGLCPADTSPTTLQSYLIIVESGEQVIKKYHELYNNKCINYTWVAVHNLFMAGTSYLYALYNSPEVRYKSTIEEIELNTAACISVLSSMIDRCDAALSCRDTFKILSEAILKLWYNEKKGIVMKFPSSRYFTEQKPADFHRALDVANINQSNQAYNNQSLINVNSACHSTIQDGIKIELHSPTSNVSNSITVDPASHEPQQIKPARHEFNETRHNWPEYLEHFFQEAAQEIDVSADSDTTGLTCLEDTPYNSSNASYTKCIYKNVDDNSSNKLPHISSENTSQIYQYPQDFDQKTQQNFCDVKQQRPCESGPQKNIFDKTPIEPLEIGYYREQQYPIKRQGFHRTDGQRIYDIITEVPTTAIWDQYFAPLNNSGCSTLYPTAMIKSPKFSAMNINENFQQRITNFHKTTNNSSNKSNDTNTTTYYSEDAPTNKYNSS